MNPPAPADPLARAEEHLKGGRLSEAARLFRGVLAADPTNVEALNGLATEALLRGNAGVARPLLTRAATIEPRNAGTFAALAQVHALEGRHADADVCLATAVSLAPDRLEYRISQALRLAATGEAVAAQQALADLAQRHPEDAQLQYAIGVLELGCHHPEAAESAFSRAIALDPQLPDAWHALGMLHAGVGRAAEAMECLQAALDRAPTNAAILVALADLLLDQGEAAAAERLAREGALVAPGVVELSCVQGLALVALGRTTEALELLARTARDAPQSASPLLALADAFLTVGVPDKAATLAAAAQALPAATAAVGQAAAGLLLRAGKVAPAWAALGKALPSLPDIGRPLRLRAPRSLADTLLFLRLCPLVAAAGGSVHLSGAPALAPLLALVPGLVLDDGAGAGADGDLLLLGPLLAPHPEQLPLLALAPLPHQVAAWHAAWAAAPAPRIAIAWGGKGGLALEDVLAALPSGATAVSVVTGRARAAIAGDPRVLDAGAQIGGYTDLAALLLAVDLVVLPDGPAAHLAGALGRPGIVYVPPGGHFAWAAPWYPSLRAVRHWTPDALSGHSANG